MGARGRRKRSARLCDPLAKLGIAGKIVADQDLAGFEARKFAGEITRLDRGRDQLSGRDVERGEGQERFAVVLRNAEQRGEKIVRAGIEQALLGERARGDEADHVAADDRLRSALARLGGIFELFADGDAVPLRNQPLQVFIGRPHRHAAHRNVLALMLTALGERDPERARGDFRVLEEQLVEIPHAVEQEAVGVRGLDLEILRHHRRGALGRRRLRAASEPRGQRFACHLFPQVAPSIA